MQQRKSKKSGGKKQRTNKDRAQSIKGKKEQKIKEKVAENQQTKSRDRTKEQRKRKGAKGVK